MKKTLIALLLVGSSSALFAQNTPNTTNNTNTNTTTNSTPTDVNTSQNSSPTTDAAPPSPQSKTDASINANQNKNTDVANPNNSVNTDVQMNKPTDNSNMNNSANMSTTNSVSTGSYSAYGSVATDVPTTVRYSFQKEHPNVTGAQWYQTPNGQLRVMYKDANNQEMDMYYFGSSAQSYMISLPVRQSLTSDDILAKAKSMFGLGVYDITRVKAANMEDVYHVRLLDNGQVRSVWISEQGTEVAAADVFRTAEVAENDIINEVNTAPASGANSTNTNTTNSGNTTDNSNSTTPMNNSRDASNSNTNTNSNNTNSSASDNTTTPPAPTTETK